MPASLLMRTFAAASPVGSHRNSLASNLGEMEEKKHIKKHKSWKLLWNAFIRIQWISIGFYFSRLYETFSPYIILKNPWFFMCVSWIDLLYSHLVSESSFPSNNQGLPPIRWKNHLMTLQGNIGYCHGSNLHGSWDPIDTISQPLAPHAFFNHSRRVGAKLPVETQLEKIGRSLCWLTWVLDSFWSLFCLPNKSEFLIWWTWWRCFSLESDCVPGISMDTERKGQLGYMRLLWFWCLFLISKQCLNHNVY